MNAGDDAGRVEPTSLASVVLADARVANDSAMPGGSPVEAATGIDLVSHIDDAGGRWHLALLHGPHGTEVLSGPHPDPRRALIAARRAAIIERGRPVVIRHCDCSTSTVVTLVAVPGTLA